MTTTDRTCMYDRCTKPARVERQLSKTNSHATYHYCNRHDPLDDEEIADHWERAND